MLNPYIAGAPVVETSMFFGREDVFSWIERSLAGKYVDHILVLHGQRRVGKTSVLKQIPNFLSDRYIQVFFDLQGRTNTTFDRFLWWMAREITRALKQDRDITIPLPKREDFAADPEYLITGFLPSLRPHLGDQVLLLTFDEFDTLDRADIQETFSKPLITYLNQLMGLDWLNFVFSIGSSGDKLENMQASYTDFFKSALYRKISFLTRDDSRNLITKPVEGTIKYERKAVDRIHEITSGHPYFTQLMCHELFSLCQKTGADTVDKDDVESILDDVVERGTVNLKFVWDEANDLEKWILAGLGQLDGSGTTPKLTRLLQDHRVRFSESDLNSAIIHLRDKDVITQENQFIIHLMYLWLNVNRPLDRVREELVEVNPIANRYIEIGDEYRDRGEHQPAIESYQQALSVDSRNLKAQSSIGVVHLRAGEFAQAVAMFELALKIDDEDVVSRTGFCDATLILGDKARDDNNLDEAIKHFKKILLINPAHSDARERLRDIFSTRAEELLIAGKDDDALSNFNQAIEFTPEDGQLITRYEEVLAQKKAKVISGWLTKADQAVARKRWDDAANAIDEALKLDPDNVDLQAKLVEVKDAPRQSKIQVYRSEAEQAVQRGNFEKAIAAVETAVQLAPEDASLAEWLESMRTNQLNARLEFFLDKAENATAAGDWSEAIEAVQDAIKVAPDKAPWEAKRAEIEAAQHNAQLDTLRREAEDARAAKNFDAAIAALERIIELEPSEIKIEEEIETLRLEKREHQLAEYKSQAEKSTKTEDWDLTVKAWESYLDLEPKDRSEIEAILQTAQKLARLSGDYVEAQQAMRKKRYGRAIGLLQGIIAQDPTYKSSSRLLVEAVEANKDIPVWRRPWVIPAIAAVALIILGIFFGPRLWEAISPDNQQVSMPTFAESIFEYINDTAPDFEDDFSTVKADWTHVLFDNHIPDENLENYIIDGAFAAKRTGSESWGEINLGDLEGNTPLIGMDFALQLDVTMTELDGTTGFVIYYRAVEPLHFNFFAIQGNGTWTVMFRDLDHDEEEIVGGQTALFNLGEINQFQVIAFGDDIAVYLNGDLLTHFQYGQDEGQYINFGFGSESASFEGSVDNVKFWNLDEPIPVEAPTEVPTVPTEGPEIIVGSIQEFIVDQPPTFEDDFSVAKLEWSPLSSRASIESGTMIMTVENDEDLRVGREHIFATDFVIQYDFMSEGSSTSIGLDIRTYDFIFEIIDGWLISHGDGSLHGTPTEYRPGEWNQLMVFAQGDRFEFYLNEELLTEYIETVSGRRNYLHADTTDQGIVFIDNLKFWNLDGVNLVIEGESTVPGFYEPIQEFINMTPPEFADDFSTPRAFWNESEVHENPGLVLADLVADGVVQFNGEAEDSEFVEFGVILGEFNPLRNALVQFDFTPHALTADSTLEYVIQEDQTPGDEYRFRLQLGDEFNWELQRNPAGSAISVLQDGQTALNIDETYTLQIIVYDGQYLILLDDVLLAYVEDFQFSNWQTWISAISDSVLQIDFDNVKVWNLDGLDLSSEGESPGFYEPILTYIESETPSFEDDFSVADSVWGSTSEGLLIYALIEDGELTISDHVADTEGGMEPDHAVRGLSFPTYGLLIARDFVLDFDFAFEGLDSIGVVFQSSSAQNPAYKFEFSQEGAWELTLNNGIIASGRSWLWENFNTLRLIVYNQDLAIFLNGNEIYQTDDIVSAGGYNGFTVAGNHSAKGRFDNIKFWNLDGASSDILNLSAPEPSFYEPIQAYIEAETPSFEDDFSVANSVWGSTSDGDVIYGLINDGVLTISDRDQPGLTFPTYGMMSATDFVLEFDFRFDDLVGVGVVFGSSSAQTLDYKINFSSAGKWTLTQTNDATLIAEGLLWLEPKYNTVRLIVQDQNLAIFFDHDLLYETDDLSLTGTFNGITVTGSDGAEGKFDNVKFWNLDGVELNP
jgi:tetratricopeptide (TPR) repeat protein